LHNRRVTSSRLPAVVLLGLAGCAPPLNVLPTALPNGAEGTPYSQTLSADGSGLYGWRVIAGDLPPGMSLDDSTGRLAGTPTAAGTFQFGVAVNDASIPPRSGERSYTITILEKLILDATLGPGRVNEPYSASFGAGGGVGPYTFGVVGLPAGLSLNAATGTISGTPMTDAQALRLDVTVVDSGIPQQAATQTTFLTIKPLPVSIATTELAAGRIYHAYQASLTATNGMEPYRWAVVAGVLPEGLSLNLLTGSIHGTPTRVQSASFSVQVTDSDSPPTMATKAFTIEIGL
jgi:Putative Ig domain